MEFLTNDKLVIVGAGGAIGSNMAQTPAAELVEKYKDVKGTRNFVARGVLMKLARTMMKEYSIAPLAHKVEEVSVLRVDRVPR